MRTARGIPARPLSMDLNIVDLCRTGFWFCRQCQRITEPRDNNQGREVCLHCGSMRIKFNLPVLD
jgi:hypothetical protein